MCIIANAQDIIVKKDGTTILAKVTEVSTSDITYKKWSNQDGPIYKLPVSELIAINYQNGEKEDFTLLKDNKEQEIQSELTLDKPSTNLLNSQNQLSGNGMYKYDEKQYLLEKAQRIHSAANTLDAVALPLGIVIGVGGMFLIDSWMIWVGLGIEVTALVISGSIDSHANHIKRKADLMYGFNKHDIKLGKSKFDLAAGALNNGRIGFIINL